MKHIKVALLSLTLLSAVNLSGCDVFKDFNSPNNPNIPAFISLLFLGAFALLPK
jgi:hypothetical protein